MENAPDKIVEHMYVNDAFSQWLGIERLSERPGYCKLQMTVRDEMTNGFKVAHGGISYSLADSALAFASNSHGRHALSINTSIAHTLPVYAGDELVAEAKELSLTPKTAIYDITITNQKKQTVALFRGTVYRKSKEWEIL